SATEPPVSSNLARTNPAGNSTAISDKSFLSCCNCVNVGGLYMPGGRVGVENRYHYSSTEMFPGGGPPPAFWARGSCHAPQSLDAQRADRSVGTSAWKQCL